MTPAESELIQVFRLRRDEIGEDAALLELFSKGRARGQLDASNLCGGDCPAPISALYSHLRRRIG